MSKARYDMRTAEGWHRASRGEPIVEAEMQVGYKTLHKAITGDGSVGLGWWEELIELAGLKLDDMCHHIDVELHGNGSIINTGLCLVDDVGSESYGLYRDGELLVEGYICRGEEGATLELTTKVKHEWVGDASRNEWRKVV